MIELLDRWKLESTEIRQNVFIPSLGAFNRDIILVIEQIERNSVGKLLLEKIAHCTATIFINYGPKDVCHSLVNLKQVIIECSMQENSCFSKNAEIIALPVHVILFHELTHAYHFFIKAMVRTHFADPLVWESDEEYSTINGFPGNNAITENAFRRAEGLPERGGSWLPYPENEWTSLSKERIKLLNTLLFPLSPLKNELGLASRIVIYANIYFTEEADSGRYYLFAEGSLSDLLNEKLGYNSFLRFLDTKEKIDFANVFFPPIQGRKFEVKEACYLRLSQDEFKILQRIKK